MKRTNYRYPLCWVFFHRRDLIYSLITTTYFKVIIAMWVIPAPEGEQMTHQFKIFKCKERYPTATTCSSRATSFKITKQALLGPRIGDLLNQQSCSNLKFSKKLRAQHHIYSIIIVHPFFSPNNYYICLHYISIFYFFPFVLSSLKPSL